MTALRATSDKFNVADEARTNPGSEVLVDLLRIGAAQLEEGGQRGRDQSVGHRPCAARRQNAADSSGQVMF